MLRSLQMLSQEKFSSAELRLKLFNKSCSSELSTFFLHVAFSLQVRTILTLTDQAVSRLSPSLKPTTKPQALGTGASHIPGTGAWLPLDPPRMGPHPSSLAKK